MMTLEEARELFGYDPETGDLWPKFVSKGRPLGMVYKNTTRALYINYRRIITTHLRWFLFHGTWPEGEIDHINRNDTDHRIENMRDATPAQNMLNQMRVNPNGLKGVSFCTDPKRHKRPWLAQIRINGVKKNLGRYATKEEAHQVWLEAATEYHGEWLQPLAKSNPAEARGEI